MTKRAQAREEQGRGGRKWGKKGRAARAANMTPERRAKIARKAAAKRWK